MSRIFAPNWHVGNFAASPTESLGIVRPSGAPWQRLPRDRNVTTGVETIDLVLLGQHTAFHEVVLGLGGIAAETSQLHCAAGDTTPCDLSDTPDLPKALARETYNRSLRPYRQLGRLACANELDTQAGRAAHENVRRDLVTSLAEMLENGEAFRGGFEVSDLYEYQIEDNRVQYQTADGPKPIRQIAEEGALVSAAAARRDPLMLPQAERDRADVANAIMVDDMVAGRRDGNTRLVVSRDLGAIIRPGSPHRELYIGKGYREGLSFLQLYFFDGKKMTAGTFSVDSVSDTVFDALLAKHGVVMPTGESRNQSVKYGIELTLPDRAAAINFVNQFRRDCYVLQGDTRTRRSASEFIQEHGQEIDGYIEALCVPLAISIDSGVKQQAVHDFVNGLLRQPEHMKTEVIAHLRRIQASEGFDDDDGRRLAGIILYAIAEALYERALHFARNEPEPMRAVAPPVATGAGRTPLPPVQLIAHLSQSVHAGVRAGRDHGGACPGEVSLSNKSKAGLQDPFNPQAAFGGLEGDNKESGVQDRYGSLFFTCPNSKCRKRNERFYNQLRTHCQHCKKEIPKC